MEITIKSNILRYLFRDVYFINGTAYAGKSTMVRMLAEKHGGICCGENYHDVLMDAVDPENQPALSYFETMGSWQEFIGRTPQEYAQWVFACSQEAAGLELARLIQLAAQGRKVFVDTNIPPAMLQEISDYRHVAFLLAPQSLSVGRFFDRDDPEKQFILRQIRQAEDPGKAMENYRACLAEINSPAVYRSFADSGFFTLVRDGTRTLQETLAALEGHFAL